MRIHKEKLKVSPPAANVLLARDLIGSATSAMSQKAISANTDLEELSVLFREHYQVIFRVAYRLTGSQSDAEDVLQTIFLRLTPEQARRGLLPNPQGYLYRAAVNASVDLLRSRARARAVPLDVVDFDPSPKASVASPEAGLEDSELCELLRQAVAKLEGRAATAFTLRYYEGYDNADIAKVLGTSQMVVAVTLHRARTRLRKEIGSYLEKHHEAK